MSVSRAPGLPTASPVAFKLRDKVRPKPAKALRPRKASASKSATASPAGGGK